MREAYTRIYQDHKEDSPEGSKIQAHRIIRGEVKRLRKAGVDLGQVNYLGVGAGKGFTEAGCWHDALRHLGSVVLLDIAKRKPKTAPKNHGKYAGKYGNVANLEADAMTLPVKDSSIGILSCHMSQDFFPDRDASTREIKRVMEPGGIAAVFLHHPKMFRKIIENDPGHAYGHFWRHLLAKGKLFSSRADIERHYKSHGFDVERIEEHTPGKRDGYADYWWEVVLRKKTAK
jgi:ubiquinone/menaquinone biosynthesis C-methylase UbiE